MGDYSKELCGGTHVQATGRIGAFLIIGESSVAAGVRRFECLTGEGAVAHMQEQKRLLAEIAASLKARTEEAAERISKLQARLKELEKGAGGVVTNASLDELVKNATEKDGFKLLAAEVAAADPRVLRAMGDQLKDRLGKNAVIGLAAPSAEGKALILVMVGQTLTGRFNAGELAAKMAAEVGGKGGGRPDMAQAGGPDATRIPAALAVFESQIN
jgi:alanyl-tRNA synthetase